MRCKLRISASMTALLTALSVCAAGAVAGVALAGSPAQAAELNTENGVHAAPSGEVAAAGLGKVGARAPAPAPAPLTTPTPAPGAPPAAAASGTLTLQLVDNRPARSTPTPPTSIPVPPVAEPLAEAAPEGGSEEDAVYRRGPQPIAVPAVVTSQDAAAKLIPARDEAPAAASSIGQHVSFPRRSAEAASAFDGYMHAAAAIDAGFKSGQGVAAALRRASAYDTRQLEEGMIAYGAMAAMQSPRFVYGVMDAAQSGGDRRALIEALIADPDVAARLPGAAEASAMASGAILREARPVVDNGRAIKQAAYDVQHQGWSIAKASDQPGRLAQAKAASAERLAAREGDVARLLTKVSELNTDTGRASGAASPVVDRSLALAALSILDGTDGADQGRLDPVVSESATIECLKMAKLNLFQCLSVAGPEYEDVFCLGQHAVLDTGQCVAGGAAPAEALLLSQATRISRRQQ